MIVWRDGDFLDAAAASAPLDDRGLTLGDGVFETMRIAAGRPRRFAAHAARLAAGVARLGLGSSPALDPGGVLEMLVELARRNGVAEAAARLTVTRGSGPRGLAPPAAARPRVFATIAPAPPRNPTLTLAEVTVRRAPGSVAATCKTLSYVDNVAALIEAQERDGDEALVLDAGGAVSGAAAANVFWIAGKRLFTPALGGAVTPGTTRAALAAAEPAEEGTFGLEDLTAADAVFATNALIGVAPVRALITRDGARVAFDTNHPRLARLAEAERAAD